ncbi:uncharacterized protein LOC119939096 [Tachyglossus aculeatus]|uniref:uncharacterized protein LOC119939096 n=1 Tax=Tachyglossus aculeatus TaxID=9261 RepID=UPI0018F3A473|nr:uncharacterized protein LOC119939096 [Tachyglossus aculeatus]
MRLPESRDGGDGRPLAPAEGGRRGTGPPKDVEPGGALPSEPLLDKPAPANVSSLAQQGQGRKGDSRLRENSAPTPPGLLTKDASGCPIGASRPGLVNEPSHWLRRERNLRIPATFLPTGRGPAAPAGSAPRMIPARRQQSIGTTLSLADCWGDRGAPSWLPGPGQAEMGHVARGGARSGLDPGGKKPRGHPAGGHYPTHPLAPY